MSNSRRCLIFAVSGLFVFALVFSFSCASPVAAETIGIDFASLGAVQGTNNAVAPAAGTNFNAFDIQTADGATASFSGTLTNLTGGATTVGFSVTNNMGKASGLTAVPGQSGPAPFDSDTIGVDNYGAASVGNAARPDAGSLTAASNLVFTFSGLDDNQTYDVTGGYLHDTPNDSFNATWAADGQFATTANESGLPDAGYVTLSELSTDGSGNLEITVSRSTTHLFVAGLTLTANQPVGLLGDVNLSGAVGFSDIPPFIDLLISGEFQFEADINGDGAVSFLDIPLFIRILIGSPPPPPPSQPNFVLVFTDDQGYQDLSCYGSPTISTPRIDALAQEGIRFTSFYAQPVCGPSRDALLTGCYPIRTAHHPGFNGDDRNSPHPRLELSEITVAEILKEQGYATAAFGKWDLDGRFEFDSPNTHGPTAQGFDSYVSSVAGVSTTTQDDTDGAIAFIQANKDQPFFAYVAYNMPHIELATTPAFAGITGNGIYADVMAELDHNVGRIMDTLEAEGLNANTYVMFISDNGPWYLGNSSVHINRYGSSAAAEEMGGSALPLRGDKTTSWDGGFRVPSIMWAPGRIPSGQVCDRVATTMDVMPTIANLAGGNVPTDRVIDGNDITEIIHGNPDAEGETEVFYYYVRETLHAVRAGKWKLHTPRALDTFWERFYRTGDYIPINQPLLYNLDNDIGETTNVAGANPEVVAELMQLIQAARTDIGDFNQIGVNAR